MYFLTLLLINCFYLLVQPDTAFRNHPSPRTGSKGILVTPYDCQQKTKQKYAINAVTHREIEPPSVDSTNGNAKLHSKAGAAIPTSYKFTEKFSEIKILCPQVSN